MLVSCKFLIFNKHLPPSQLQNPAAQSMLQNKHTPEETWRKKVRPRKRNIRQFQGNGMWCCARGVVFFCVRLFQVHVCFATCFALLGSGAGRESASAKCGACRTLEFEHQKQEIIFVVPQSLVPCRHLHA